MNFSKRGESVEHKLLKAISKRALEARGYNVQTEGRVGNSTVDVLAKNEDHVTVVECEAFRDRQKRDLKTRFGKALLSFPSVKRVLCIPKFVELEEIWVVDPNSGYLTCYFPLKGDRK